MYNVQYMEIQYMYIHGVETCFVYVSIINMYNTCTIQCTCYHAYTMLSYTYNVVQALLQSGEIEESIPHFQQALQLLNTNLPSSRPRVMMSIISQALRQCLHVRFPRRFIGQQRCVYMYMYMLSIHVLNVQCTYTCTCI